MINKNAEEIPISIPYYFKEAVRKYRNLVAITDRNGSITYEELDKKSDFIANYMIRRGIKAGSIIAILMERTRESIVMMLGILKAGCVYMYIDKKYPSERVNYMIYDSDTELVVCDFNFLKSEPWAEKAIEYVSINAAKEAGSHFNNIENGYGSYLIYTSGSTGKPKGLLISHANFISLYETWGKEHFSLKDNVNVAVIAPFVFDMCVLMIYASLFKGHNLYIIPDELKQSGQGIVNFLNKHQIKIMDVTPNYLRLIDNYLQYNREEKLNVKRIFCIGDVLSYQLAKNIMMYADDSEMQLYNTYGPAECTVLMTYFVINKDNINEIDNIPIGKPTPNASFIIVDEYMNEVKGGEVGELIILGECVGLGYISKHLKETGPFGILNLKSYKTGDLVKCGDDGILYFIGRVDRQCKINGYRVELEEIEKEIENIEGIREAKVIVKKETSIFSKLYAFYTGTTKENVKQVLRDKLPHYMIPQEIWSCNEFPSTHNGKVDYKSLLDHLKTSKDCDGREIGEYAFALLNQLLGREIDSKELSFFEAGGDSITLLAFISEISSKYNVRIDISKLYTCNSINEMVTYLRKLSVENISEKSGAIIQEILPIIEPQKKLYNLEKKSLKSNIENRSRLCYSLLYKIIFDKEIETERLEECINKVIQNNEIFYLGLKVRHNRCFCYKKNATPFIHIKKGKDESMVLDEFNSFYVDSDPFVEFIKYGENVVYLNVKHIYMDFISVQYFLDDILKMYVYNALPSERIGFLTYLNCNNFEEERVLTYWKKKLEHCPSRTTLPFQVRGKDSFHIIRDKCENSVYNSLNRAAKQKSTSVFTILLCYFIKNIKKYTGSDLVRIGCYCPGRNYEYDNGVMGMLTNVLPLICEISKDSEILHIVKKEILDMIKNQNISLSRLYQSIPLEEIADGELFDICFNYQNTWLCMEDSNLPVKCIETINVNPDITKRNFYFGIIEENGEMRWEISYNRGCYTEELIRAFIKKMKEEIIDGTV